MLTFFFQSAEVPLCYILLLLKIQYVVISIFKYLYRCKSGYTIKTRAKSVCYPGPLPSALIMLFSLFMKIRNHLFSSDNDGSVLNGENTTFNS